MSDPSRPVEARITARFRFNEVLSDLIRLCHLDRHANSDLGERANRATQWLLSQRKTRSRS